MKKSYGALLTVLAVAVISINAHAAVVADWDLSGMVGTEATKTANSAATGVTGNALARGAGLTGSSGANSMNASGWNSQATDYFSFGFTVADEYSVDLSDLVIATRSSATGPGAVGLYYSGDNFSNALYTFNQAPGANFVNAIVDLSALHNLTGNVEFRIKQIGSTAANGGTTGSAGTFRVAEYEDSASNFVNLELNGAATPTVPVPASIWLMGSSLLGLAAVARKRRTA